MSFKYTETDINNDPSTLSERATTLSFANCVSLAFKTFTLTTMYLLQVNKLISLGIMQT